MADATVHGVDLGWMQAQWRDCADKAAQLAIFRDMTGGKATIQQILEAVGEPDYMGPEPVKRKYERYTEEDEDLIVRMAAEGATDKTIADALGKTEGSVSVKITAMRRKGIDVRRGEKPKEEPPAVPGQPKAAPKDSFSKIESELNVLLKREEDLLDRLETVRAEIAAYRKRLCDLLAMAGGGLGNA